MSLRDFLQSLDSAFDFVFSFMLDVPVWVYVSSFFLLYFFRDFDILDLFCVLNPCHRVCAGVKKVRK